MPEAPGGRANRWLTILTPDRETAGAAPMEVIETLADENIEARPVWKPLHAQPIFAEYAYYPHSEGDSVSDRLFATGLCLPSGSNLSEEDQDRVITAVRRALGAESASVRRAESVSV
jgi:pyridoxal phosphate-dependent aminotransferase EpsN